MSQEGAEPEILRVFQMKVEESSVVEKDYNVKVAGVWGEEKVFGDFKEGNFCAVLGMETWTE